mgnify:CR=1 FL=1
MSSISILHLSDIHFKLREDQPTFRTEVQVKLLKTISNHSEKYGYPEYVAVTGDIAWDGKDYTEAENFFKNLKSMLPVETIFLVVPGNHDVNREKLDPFLSLHDIVTKKLST